MSLLNDTENNDEVLEDGKKKRMRECESER